MSKIAVVAKLIAAEGKRDDLVNALKPLLDAVQEEPGTLAYGLHTANDDANVVLFYELYEDDAALGAHSGSAAMKAVGPTLAGLLGGAPEILRYTPVGGKGFPL